MKIFVRHLRKAGICLDVKKQYFDVHGLDFKQFLREGIEVEKLREIGDRLDMIDLLEKAAQEEENGKV